MNTWIFYLIQYTLKYGQPFLKNRGWSIDHKGYYSMNNFYIKKDGKYLAIETHVVEDDYWEITEINEVLKSYSHWVSKHADAKSFTSKVEAELYMNRNRLRGCEVVALKI